MAHPSELTRLLHRALEARLGRLLELWAVEGWPEDPEGVHQVRVASRRVRAVLDLVDPDAYPGFKRHARQLKRITRALGATRELDVHVLHLGVLRDRLPDALHAAAAEHLLEHLERKLGKARERMHRGLARVSPRDLGRLLVQPEDRTLGVSDWRGAVWRCLEPWGRAVEAPLPGLLAVEDGAGLHLLRIQVKRFRYTLEVLEAAFPEPLADLLQDLRELQTALGRQHDHAVLEAFLAKAHGGLDARRRPVLANGVLDLATLAAEERQAAYGRFQSLGQALLAAAPLARLRGILERSSGAMA
ncbi:MAG TPA: CHAD domain-containing protein [Holophaga sp.]|nr:CHAD domain-containing protein [Holophaga sp.]